MRKEITVLIMLLISSISFGQTIEPGTILTFGEPSKGIDYKHIQLPKRNIIIKRGAIANYKALIGHKVQVVETTPGSNGKTSIVLQKLNGKNFFRFYKFVSADIEKALASGELRVL